MKKINYLIISTFFIHASFAAEFAPAEKQISVGQVKKSKKQIKKSANNIWLSFGRERIDYLKYSETDTETGVRRDGDFSNNLRGIEGFSASVGYEFRAEKFVSSTTQGNFGLLEKKFANSVYIVDADFIDFNISQSLNFNFNFANGMAWRCGLI